MDFPLNDDLLSVVISYLDITEYTLEQRDHLLDEFYCQDHEKIMSFWRKESNVNEVMLTTGRVDRKVNGKLHCETGPATIWPDGSFEWWFNNKLHREDGPAIVYTGGDTEWWRHGKLHRRDGPAILHSDGARTWCIDGMLHRADGPAVEHADGTVEWWMYDGLVSSTCILRSELTDETLIFI